MTKEEMIKRQQELVSGAKAAGRSMTPEETAEFDTLQRQIDAGGGAPNGGSGGTAGDLSGNPPVGGEEAARQAIIQERQRVADITSLCRSFEEPVDEYIRSGAGIDQVRAAIIARLQKDHPPIGVSVQTDETDKFRAAAIDGLCLRAGGKIEKPAAGANDFRGMSLRGLAIECLSREGKSMNELNRQSGDKLYDMLSSREFFSPSASFPVIMDSVINKRIVEVYSTVGTTFGAWTTKGSMSDFKTDSDHEYLIGGADDFKLMPENGEFQQTSISTDTLPHRKLETYGKEFSMSRQAFINDDIGWLTNTLAKHVASAKRTIDKQVYAMIVNNGTIYDDNALFDTTKHINLAGTDAAPTQTSIQAIINLMRKQTDPFGEALYMTPRYLIVPTGYEFDLAVIFNSAQVVGSPNNDINPLYNYPLTVVQSPYNNTLAGANKKPWFLVTDPMSAYSVQVDYLNGQETPSVRRLEGTSTLGFRWQMYLDWAVWCRDYRGIYRNNGAV